MRDFIERHGAGRWLLNLALILAAFAALGLFRSWAASDTRDARYDFCVEVEQVRGYARDAASRALATLPTLAYYKHHPKELKQAVESVQRQIDFFSPPLDCNKFSKL